MQKLNLFTFLITLLILVTLTAPVCLAQEIEEITEPNNEETLEPELPIDNFYATAIVQEINDVTKKDELSEAITVTTQQEVVLKILNTKLKDREFTIINEVTTNPVDIKLEPGNKIIVNIDEFNNENYQIFIIGHYRLNSIILLVSLFLILLILLGGKQGLKTVISLVISFLLIFKLLIPQVLNGFNPLILALIVSLAVAIITLVLIAGLKKKALIAICGTIGGLIFAVLISYIFAKLTNLNGLSSEEARTLFYKLPEINPYGIFFAGIIIAALGAVMDVAMSIASSLNEISQLNKSAGFNKLFKSGINVGKDIIGTMSNTLIFAYVGVSLPLLLLYQHFGDSFTNFLNLDFITDEIVRSLSGSIGLIAVIPITAFIGAYLYKNNKS